MPGASARRGCATLKPGADPAYPDAHQEA
jgi:hypothetical protein